MLSQNIPHPHNDPHLDFPCLPSSSHGPISSKSHRCPSRLQRSSKNKLRRDRSRGCVHPRHWIPRELNDLQRLHLPPHDTKTATRDNSTRNGTPPSLASKLLLTS